MSIKYSIDSEFIKKLINENLLYFFIISQISSDNILEKSNVEKRLNIIKSMKNAMVDLCIQDKDKYLCLLSKSEEILLGDLKKLSN